MKTQRAFSPESRADNLSRMAAATDLDLLVIGGGITGAGIARDASLRGLRVGLVERQDFAGGTSSRSSKLIHGGIRYLQLGDFALVRESAAERQILRQIAPHIVRPERMVVLAHSRRSLLALNVGLWTYERLGNITASERYVMWNREEAIARIPRLRPTGIRGAVAYYESLTQDARLVLDTLKDAHVAGALVANHAGVTALHIERGRVAGVRVHDAIADRDIDIAASVVINAAGPWVDAVRRLEGPLPRQRIHLTKGVHVTLPKACLPVEHIVAFRAHDRRTVFVVPRGEVIYVGTTDTDYGTPVERPEITREDVAYLLSAVERTFAAPDAVAGNVLSAWAGLRPLMHEEGKAPSEISRKDEIMVGPSGLISIAGGKLTTYRRMAARSVAMALKELERLGVRTRAIGPCRTDRRPLPGGDCSGDEMMALEERLQARYPDVSRLAVSRLVNTYGTQAEAVLAPVTARPELAKPLGNDRTLLRAEVRYAIDHEMALGIEDILDRRTAALLFAPDQGLGALGSVAEMLAVRLGWTKEREDNEKTSYEALAASLRPGTSTERARSPDGDATQPPDKTRSV